MSRIMGFIHDELVAREGWEVEFFCQDRLAGTRSGAVTRLTFPMQLAHHVRREFLAGRPYDLVNVHEPYAAIPVWLKHWMGNSRIVVTSHGLEERAWRLENTEARLRRKAPPSWRSRLSRGPTILWPARYALTHADHVLCLNEEDKAFLQGSFGVPAARITRIHPGAAETFRLAMGNRDYTDGKHLLYAGTWRYNKGITDLVATFERLAALRPDVTLTVLGAGVPASVVEAEFSQETRPRVRVIPSATESEAVRVFAEADVFILPSLFEGTPLTLIEAMSSGLPIITTNTCGMRDVITHGRNGLLAEIRSPDGLATLADRLLDDASLREALGWQASADVQEYYTWTKAAEPVRLAYRNLFTDSN